MELVQIQKAAKLTDVSPDTLRYYEKCELIKPARRNESGYRGYDQEDIKKILFIRNAQQLGFSLKEIKGFLELRIKPGAKAGQVRKRAQEKLDSIHRKARNLKAIEKVLNRLICSCDDPEAPVEKCPILLAIDDFKLTPSEKKSFQEFKKGGRS